MVVEPHHADLQEADEVGDVGRPLLPERRRQRDTGLRRGALQVEGQQRDHDGEHAVRERLEPALGHHAAGTYRWARRSRRVAITSSVRDASLSDASRTHWVMHYGTAAHAKEPAPRRG